MDIILIYDMALWKTCWGSTFYSTILLRSWLLAHCGSVNSTALYCCVDLDLIGLDQIHWRSRHQHHPNICDRGWRVSLSTSSCFGGCPRNSLVALYISLSRALKLNMKTNFQFSDHFLSFTAHRTVLVPLRTEAEPWPDRTAVASFSRDHR